MMKKNALITGASRGIGLAVAKHFAKRGYNLDLIAKNPERLESVSVELKRLSPEITIKTHAIDLSQAIKAYDLVKSIAQTRGKIDVLFNNAGILIQNSIVGVGLSDFQKMLDVNVSGAFAVAKAVAEHMKAQESGYIFNLASLAGKRGLANNGGYCASKFAVVGFSDSLFKELLPYNVNVTSLCPSAVNTDMTKTFNLPSEEKIQPDDIVDTIDFLLHRSAGCIISNIDIQCKAIAMGAGVG